MAHREFIIIVKKKNLVVAWGTIFTVKTRAGCVPIVMYCFSTHVLAIQS